MTGLREVVFLGRAWAEAMTPDDGHAIVSIADAGGAPAALRPGWGAVLRLHFDDVDPDQAPPGEFEAGLVPMTPAQALQIARFVHAAAATSTTLVVHCRFGQSRSPAVAKAVCEHVGLDFPAAFRTHNRFVYRLVRDALADLSRNAQAITPR